MESLKFTLSGTHAMFKKPDVNSFYYYTYGQIHKPALLGVFGAVMGYRGYGQMGKKDAFPEYYQKLHHLQISIVPKADRGYFPKRIVCFNNSVGYASQEQGGNLIVKEQWLESPSWDIYLLLDCGEAEKLADSIVGKRCEYIPYLGKNDHGADITDVSVMEAVQCETATVLDCLVPKNQVQFGVGMELFGAADEPFKYEEALPIALEEATNQYILGKFLFTNMEFGKISAIVWEIGEKNVVFY